MSLMHRIKIHNYLSMTSEEKAKFITEVRHKREELLAKSKLAPKRKVRVGKHSSKPRSRTKDPIKEAAKLLAKLSTKQLEAIEASYKIKGD